MPDAAETGFGYIEAGRPAGRAGAAKVRRFVEKPDEGSRPSLRGKWRFPVELRDVLFHGLDPGRRAGAACPGPAGAGQGLPGRQCGGEDGRWHPA
ncbi:sugar phosphate nucleotidyltransferase [Pseudomonas aeruginosa]